MLFNELTEAQKTSFKFQFARDITNKLSRKEIMALFCLVAIQANENQELVKQTGIMEQAYTAYGFASRLIIKHVDGLNANWRDTILQLCADFDCQMTVDECISMLMDYIDAGCAEEA